MRVILFSLATGLGNMCYRTAFPNSAWFRNCTAKFGLRHRRSWKRIFTALLSGLSSHWISCLFASMKEVGLRMEVALLKRVGEEKRVLNDIPELLLQTNPEGNPASGLSRSVS